MTPYFKCFEHTVFTPTFLLALTYYIKLFVGLDFNVHCDSFAAKFLDFDVDDSGDISKCIS